MRIDCHTHATGLAVYNLLRGRYPTGQSVRDLVLKLSSNRVDYAVCFPISSPLYFEGRALDRGSFEPGGIEDFPYQLLNVQHLREATVFGGGRILPFAGIAPAHEADRQVEELERLAFGLFGLKHHTRATNSMATALVDSPFVRFARRHDLPIILHTNPNPDWTHARHVLVAADAHPEVRFCIAHAADLDSSVLQAVKSRSNVFIDVSPLQSLCFDLARLNERSGLVPGLDLARPATVLAALHQLLPDQVLWGTDEPWTAISEPDGTPLTRFDYAGEVGLLEDLAPDARRAVCCSNPIRWLFGEELSEEEAAARIGVRLDESGARLAEIGLADR